MTDDAGRDELNRIRRRTLLGGAALGAAAAAAGGARAQEADSRPLAGRIALVTGAARGIGRATAVELARHGADVALLDIANPDAIPTLRYPLASPGDLDEAVRLVEAEGARALRIAADVRDLPALRKAVARTEEELGGLDIVVANAGVWAASEPGEADHENWRAVLDVNLLGVTHTADAAVPALRRSDAARLVIVSSQNARGGSAQTPAYSASKWGVTGLMKSLALALGPSGIAVNAVAPTATDTVLLREGPFAGTSEAEMEASMRQSQPLGVGVLDPAEIAGAIAFLSGPEARRISGVMLDVNAGGSGRFSA